MIPGRLVPGRLILLAALVLGLPVAAPAQSVPVPIPKNVVLPNYDNVFIGAMEALESGAYLARTDDATAGFYNPAGLAASPKTSLSASANGFFWTQLTSRALGQTGGPPSSSRGSAACSWACLRKGHERLAVDIGAGERSGPDTPGAHAGRSSIGRRCDVRGDAAAVHPRTAEARDQRERRGALQMLPENHCSTSPGPSTRPRSFSFRSLRRERPRAAVAEHARG